MRLLAALSAVRCCNVLGVFVVLSWGSALGSLTHGFIAVQGKQGCSMARIEWVVFYESVWFLGQLSHSLKGSGFCLHSAKLKMFLFCSSRMTLCRFIHFCATISTSVLKPGFVLGSERRLKRKSANHSWQRVKSVCGDAFPGCDCLSVEGCVCSLTGDDEWCWAKD